MPEKKTTKKKKSSTKSTAEVKLYSMVYSRRGQKDDDPPPAKTNSPYRQNEQSESQSNSEEQSGDESYSKTSQPHYVKSTTPNKKVQSNPSIPPPPPQFDFKTQVGMPQSFQQQQQQQYFQQFQQNNPQQQYQNMQNMQMGISQPQQMMAQSQQNFANQNPNSSNPFFQTQQNSQQQQQQTQGIMKRPPVFQGQDNQSFAPQSSKLTSPPFQNMDRPPALCVHHSEKFQFFCETCEEPICTQCTILGPHNSQQHRISRIQEAFKNRYVKISEQIKGNMAPKRDSLLAQIHRIEYRIEEIKYVKTIIERDIRVEFEGLLERLKSAEGMKLAILNHEIGELQKDLDLINELGQQFEELTSNEQMDPSPFLLRSRYLYDKVEHAVAKPFKSQVDVYPYDLPRELTELRLQLQRMGAQNQLLEFKDNLIWQLINEKKQEEDSLRVELEKQTEEEVNEWAQLVDKYQNELNRFKLVCCYCGTVLDPDILNLPCKMNSNGENIEFKVETRDKPPQEFNGSGQHFFCKGI